jgi:hypothetical protein
LLRHTDDVDQFSVHDEQLPEESTIGMAAEFLTIDARLKCKESGTVSDVKIDHPINAKVPVKRWVADVSTIATMFDCLDVLAHAKPPLGELNMIN